MGLLYGVNTLGGALGAALWIGYLLLGGGFAMNAMHGGVGIFFLAMTTFTIGEMLSQPMRAA